MPTITEIQNPNLTYCQKYDLYCPCIKCDGNHHTCIKVLYPTNSCDKCLGPETGQIQKVKLLFLFFVKNRLPDGEEVLRCPSTTQSYIKPSLNPQPVYLLLFPARFPYSDNKEKT